MLTCTRKQNGIWKSLGEYNGICFNLIYNLKQ